MNAPLRRVALAVFVLFGMLFANLNYVQFVKGSELRRNPINKRVQLQEYDRKRGSIAVGSEAIALSDATNDKLKYLRRYPANSLYAHVVGFKSVTYGETGLERSEDPILSGDDDRLFVRRVSGILTGHKTVGGDVVLTLDKGVQEAAQTALVGRKGAIAAIDPRTGAILGLASGPTFDPNPLSSHDYETEKKAYAKLSADPDKPMLNRALRQTYPPGSTFKVIVSSTAVKDGMTASSTVESPDRYTPPQTDKFIENFHGESCGGASITMKLALTVSCNTAFAKLGNKLGADKIRATARDFGFEQNNLQIPLAVSASELGPMDDPPKVAQSSIGQRDVRMTPLQGAMIAAAVANNGTLMRPHLIQEIQAPDRSTLEPEQVGEMSRPLTPEQAAQVQDMMVGVVQSGTGKKAQINGIVVGGKTGTAEDGDSRADHSWFIGYAIKDGVAVGAVAVVLENAGTSSKSTAGLAGDVLRAIIDKQRPR
ncbi:MAG: penicillin-binding protein [Cryptosporangiaceae bacterium]|nr:penicillin-binding protein [Cryptosporangiaceae bacterium]